MNGIEYVPEEEWKELTQKNRVPLNNPLDYISRQAAIDAVDSGMCTFYDCEVIERLEQVPSADVRENVRGEWLEREVTEDVGQGIQQWQQARCSVCGKWHTTPYMYYFTDYNFCPNCGADMRQRGNINE